jgi:hypothetical protein
MMSGTSSNSSKGENMHKKLAVIALFICVISVSGWAQQDPFVGTWKLNVAKSKYGAGQAPKSQTRTVVVQGKGIKVSFDGVAADGSRIAYSYTTNYDGKEGPITGTGQANGADTIAVKRVDAGTTTATLKKAGKVVSTTTGSVSKDGKTYTIDSKGVDANGKPRNVVSVYDKQ